MAKYETDKGELFCFVKTLRNDSNMVYGRKTIHNLRRLFILSLVNLKFKKYAVNLVYFSIKKYLEINNRRLSWNLYFSTFYIKSVDLWWELSVVSLSIPCVKSHETRQV